MTDERFDALVIGAGMAGLACAARLRARGVRRFSVVDQGDGVGAAWRRRYERLSLNSPFHDLPDDRGLRDRWGIFFSRTEIVSYLEAYAELHELTDALRFGERVLRVDRAPGGWDVCTTRGRCRATCLVIATAANRRPRYPDIPGQQRFAGRVVHSAEYWNAEPFRGARVLVVGSGNSAADISLDLVEGGAQSVALLVRRPRHVLEREAFGRSAAAARRMGVAFTPASVVDAHQYTSVHPDFARRIAEQDGFLECFALDLARFGIRRPAEGPATQTCTTGREPWYDMGTAREIEAGTIEVIDGCADPLVGFTADGVELASGARRFDAVVFGTGFVPALEDFVDERLLSWHDGRGCLMPKTDGRCRSAIDSTLFFPGFDSTPYVGLSLGLWGAEAAEAIADIVAGSRAGA